MVVYHVMKVKKLSFVQHNLVIVTGVSIVSKATIGLRLSLALVALIWLQRQMMLLSLI